MSVFETLFCTYYLSVTQIVSSQGNFPIESIMSSSILSSLSVRIIYLFARGCNYTLSRSREPDGSRRTGLVNINLINYIADA